MINYARLTDDAFMGLKNKAKRDRLILDLLEHRDIVDGLDPANLVTFEDYLAMDHRDQIGVNDVAGYIYLQRRLFQEALEVAQQSIKLADLHEDPVYKYFAKIVLDHAERQAPFTEFEELFRGSQMEIVYYYGESLVKDA